MSHCSRYFVLSKNLGRLCTIPNTTISRFATAASENPKVVESPKDKNFAITEKAIKDAEELANRYHKYVSDAIVRWDKCNEIYYGKERDMVNYPTIKIAEQHPKVRLGFIPDAWFQLLYSRTGVTGPYLFLTGTTAFLLSKEYWVVDAHFVEIIPFVIIMTWAIKTFGSRCSDYIGKFTQQRIDNFYTKPMRNTIANLDRTIKSADEEIARAAFLPTLVAAKKENIDLQLEAAYRERLQNVYKAVIRRLDYHVERENVRRRFQQQHMANWITSAVVAGITPNQERETLRKCIEDLKVLAATKSTAKTA
ncbi:ATP synthase subunit b [Echinococcus granulosus]|uniref:ATP synthase subunit b n=1 Tax=Echinococcus granulosus TaxID=6210 RepID=W6UTJ9_ECHGR|nr:ATP synthase subunit b [Echinococcus granulosus]EUB61702.1 ATP synthase subunit b [Echinococcus granulosus]